MSTKKELLVGRSGWVPYYLRALRQGEVVVNEDGEEVAAEDVVILKGLIAAAADFPLPASADSGVEPGFLYLITADVTDNDPTKTNTSQEFKAGDTIYWLGSAWAVAGSIPDGTIVYKGEIADAADFAAVHAGDLEAGHMYHMTGDATDAATGQTFSDGDEIFWAGTLWIATGLPLPADLVTAAGTLTDDNIMLGAGGKASKDGGATIAGVLSSAAGYADGVAAAAQAAAEAASIAKATGTAKGSLVGFSAASTPGEIGPAVFPADEGKVIVARAAQATGFALEAPAAGGAFEVVGSVIQPTAGNTDKGVEEGTGLAVGSRAHAEGFSTAASGEASHAEGYQTQTSVDAVAGHAEGFSSKAHQWASHAEGNMTNASGTATHAEGSGTTATGMASHAEGWLTLAIGQFGSHAEGQQTRASGQASHAEGYQTQAVADYAHAEGQTTYAYGTRSHAEGYTTFASGAASHSEGIGTYAYDQYCHAEGNGSRARGEAAHAEGYQTQASGVGAHAEGQSTHASGQASHAGGYSSKAVIPTSYAHAGGMHSVNGDAQVIELEMLATTTDAGQALATYMAGLSDVPIPAGSALMFDLLAIGSNSTGTQVVGYKNRFVVKSDNGANPCVVAVGATPEIIDSGTGFSGTVNIIADGINNINVQITPAGVSGTLKWAIALRAAQVIAE